MLRGSVDALHADEGAVKSVGFGVSPVEARVSAVPLTGWVRVRWVGQGVPGELGGPRGLYGDAHRVPRVEKDLQVAAREWLELDSGDLCWVEIFFLVSD